MSDFMLRTNTEDEMHDALIAAGVAQEVTDADGEVAVVPVPGVSIDHIGPIPASLDPEGEVIRPGDPRWHANLRVRFELTDDQEAELPQVFPSPAVPYRVFA